MGDRVDNVIAVDNPKQYINDCFVSLARFDKIIVKDRDHAPGDPSIGWKYDHDTDEFIAPLPAVLETSKHVALAINEVIEALDISDPQMTAEALTNLILAKKGETKKAEEKIIKELEKNRARVKVDESFFGKTKEFYPDEIKLRVKERKALSENRKVVEHNSKNNQKD